MNRLSLFSALFMVMGLLVAPRPRAASAAPEAPAEITSAARREAVRKLGPEIAAIFRDHAISNHFPGLAFGVVVDGELVAAGGHGFADLAAQTPATPRSLFRIASMTKSFTAVAILQLRDQGRLQLDVPAARYLPELRRVKYLPPTRRPLPCDIC